MNIVLNQMQDVSARFDRTYQSIKAYLEARNILFFMQYDEQIDEMTFIWYREGVRCRIDVEMEPFEDTGEELQDEFCYVFMLRDGRCWSRVWEEQIADQFFGISRPSETN